METIEIEKIIDEIVMRSSLYHEEIDSKQYALRIIEVVQDQLQKEEQSMSENFINDLINI